MHNNAAILLLVRHPFFYHMLQNSRIAYTTEDKYLAYVTVKEDGIYLYLNEKRMATLTEEEQAGLLVHEYCHVLSGHLEDKAMSHLKGVAMDLQINCRIPEVKYGPNLGLSASKENPDSLRGCYTEDFGFPENKHYTQYYKSMQQDDNNGNGHQDHDYFDLSIKDREVVNSMLAHAVQKAASKSNGEVPEIAKEFLVKHEKNSSLPWATILRKWLRHQVGSKSISTWNKHNRRFPGAMPGYKKLPKARILIALDASGSITDEVYQLAANELNAIHDQGDVVLDVIEFDTIITQRYKYTKNMAIIRKASGGTSFVPIHKEAVKGGYKSCVIFSDGYGEFACKSDVKYDTLWVLKDGVESVPYGRILRL